MNECAIHVSPLKTTRHKNRHGVLEKDIVFFMDLFSRILLDEDENEQEFPVDYNDPRVILMRKIKPLLSITGMHRTLQIAMLRMIAVRMDKERMYPQHAADESPFLLWMIGMPDLPWHKAHGRLLMRTIYARHTLINRYIHMDNTTINRVLRDGDGPAHDTGYVAGLHQGAVARLSEPTDEQKKLLCADISINHSLMQHHAHLLGKDYVNTYVNFLLPNNTGTYADGALLAKFLFTLPVDYLNNRTFESLLTECLSSSVLLKRQTLRVAPYRIDKQLWECIKVSFFKYIHSSRITRESLRLFIMDNPYFTIGHVRDIADTGERDLVHAMFDNPHLPWTKGMVSAVLSVVKNKSRYVQDLTVSAFTRMGFIDERFQSDDGSQELWSMDDYKGIVSAADPKYRRTHMAFVRDDVVYENDNTTDASKDKPASKDAPDTTEPSDVVKPNAGYADAMYILFDYKHMAATLKALSWDSDQQDYGKSLLTKVDASRGVKVGHVLQSKSAIDAIVKDLMDGFPHFKPIIDLLGRQMVLSMLTQSPLRMPPILCTGAPGIGKTTFTSKMSQALGLFHRVIHMETLTGGMILSGLGNHWANPKTGLFFDTMLESDVCNPIIILDELDKAKIDNRWSTLTPLYAVLEPSTARCFQDELVASPIDMSLVNWIATANKPVDVIRNEMGDAILSRFTVFELQDPSLEDRRSIVSNMYKSYVNDNRLSHIMDDTLDVDVLDILAHGSLRDARKNLEDGCSTALANVCDHLDSLKDKVRITLEDTKGGQSLTARFKMGFTVN